MKTFGRIFGTLVASVMLYIGLEVMWSSSGIAGLVIITIAGVIIGALAGVI